MKKITAFFLFLFLFAGALAQMRNGWRSVYDKTGRLTQMLCYDRGILIPDSTYYYQYHSDRVVRAIINGEILSDSRYINGQKFLFDEAGNLTSYTIERGGQTLFSTACDYYGNCASTWVDLFESESGSWQADSITCSGSELILHNQQSYALALYEPAVSIDLNGSFVLYVRIPSQGNSVKQGMVFGWENPENFYLVEITQGLYYSIMRYENGLLTPISGARETLKNNTNPYNDIKVSSNGKDLLFEINTEIVKVIPLPSFRSRHIGLIARSKGNARFSDFGFKYPLPKNHAFYTGKWIGKGSGFFITPGGKILTTWDVVSDCKRLRIKANIGGQILTLPVEVVRLEEEQNLAVLQVSKEGFSLSEELPYGYSSRKALTDAEVFSIGYPNAVSGIFMEPEVFPGVVLPTSGSQTSTRLLEMSYRSGMAGSPVFDNNAYLSGIMAI
nr:serine protease [Prolixibacteraceae bacterium]